MSSSLLAACWIRAPVNLHVVNNGLNAHDSAWWNVAVAEVLVSHWLGALLCTVGVRCTGKLSTSDFDCAAILPPLNFTFKGYSRVVKGGNCYVGVFEVCVCVRVCVWV